MSTVELKQLLRNGPSPENNLYEHLTDTFMKILIDKSSTSFNDFEKISSHVKQNPLKVTKYNDQDSALSDNKKQLNSIKLNWTNKVSSLLKIPNEQPAYEIQCPDLTDEFNVLEWANLSIGKCEVYQLTLSIRKLSESLSPDVKRLRFFGKILTKGLPYYVLEGMSPSDDDDDSDEVDEAKQEGKSGVNKYAYWVCQSVTVNKPSEWKKLPNVSMEQIVLSSSINRYLTGSLDSPVPSFPPFPGTEKNYLRAKIAIILGFTSISPEGFFELDEDSDIPSIKLSDPSAMLEKTLKTSSDLKLSENWKHHELEVNSIGRITALPEVEDAEGNSDDNTSVEVTKPLEDVKATAWSFRVCPGGAGTHDTSSYVVARSLEWPGAIAVGNGKRFLNVYFGCATKFEETVFKPLLPALVEQEWDINSVEAKGCIEQEDIKEDLTPPEPVIQEGDEEAGEGETQDGEED